MSAPAWPPLEERTFWEQVDAVMSWYTWALLVGLLFAALLAVLAWYGLRGGDELERRPVPLPDRRPAPRAEHAARHRAGPPLQPPPGRVSWLGSKETQGWWIWEEEPPGRPYVDRPYDG